MRTKFRFFTKPFYLYLLASLLGTFAHANSIDLESLAVSDAKLESSTKELCEMLGEACSIYKSLCPESPLPNACFQRKFLFHAIEIQTCGEQVNECLEEREKYRKKVEKFIKDYASDAGLGRAAINICKPFFQIEPEHPVLVGIQENLNDMQTGLGQYYSQKKFYECIKEQYMKSMSDLL